ncbi:MAG: PEP-CTERM sorting domain-containing protein [Akkermansia muciniphila]|nr:PEP-CTERM sorting domain-containing protein [Akkermansia muciniphila]
MKKTLIALMALASMAGAAELTTLVTMDELISAASTNTATQVNNMSVTTYDFGNGTYIGGITLQSLNTAVRDSSQYITIAAWVKPDDTAGVEAIFGYGAQQNGFKFCTNGSGLQYTAKGVADRATAGSDLTADTWILVGVSFKGGTTVASGKYIAGTGNSNYYTRDVGGFALPGETEQTFSIGSGNSGSARETFNGQIAGLTIFTSSEVISGVNDITTIMGTTAPYQVPEPSTATLSLLALVGLAARRRRGGK